MARYPYTDAHRAEERAERRRLLTRQVDQRPVTSPVGMIEPRVAFGKFDALQQVWPYVQSRDLEGLATAFPTSSAKFLDREARSAVMTCGLAHQRHVSRAAPRRDRARARPGATLLGGLRPGPARADQVGDFLDWHGQTGRPSQQQLAIEWGRHWS